MPNDEHGLALVTDRRTRSSAHLRIYQDEVCLEIRMHQPMSPAHQKLLRETIAMIAADPDIDDTKLEPIPAAR